jgi:DNA-binding NarL/FixJ family response regulator
VQNYALTIEEELVLKSLAAGLKEEEIQGVLLDPGDAPVAFYVESLLSKLGLSVRSELLQYARSYYGEEATA